MYLRARKGIICAAKVDGLLIIDIRHSPVSASIRRNTKAAPFTQPSDMPMLKSLVQVRNFCQRSNIRGHSLYRDVIAGKLEAWYFADEVFIEHTDALSAYVNTRK